MSLEVRKNSVGGIRPVWYGVYRDHNGKKMTVPLKEPLPVELYPGSLKKGGCVRWEASRTRAQKELDDFVEEARKKGRADRLTEKLIESKTGQGVQYVKVEELAERWRLLSRNKKPTKKYLEWCDSVFKRFKDKVSVEYLHEVTSSMAQEFSDSVSGKLSVKTVRDMEFLLSSAFSKLLPVGCKNPFQKEIQGRGGKLDTISRKPVTGEELNKILEYAKESDPMSYKLAACAAYTGLRIGDVCCLKWDCVDLDEGWINVATSKTGQVVDIPIFKELKAVLDEADIERVDGSEYVFPDAAKLYKEHRHQITYKGNKLFAKALFKDKGKSEVEEPVYEVPEDSWEQAIAAAMEHFEGEKGDKVVDTLRRVSEGQSYSAISRETGRSKGVTSDYLREVEELTGLSLRKGATKKSGGDVKSLISKTQKKREVGIAGSQYGWHSLRATFVVEALTRGVPIETVKKITGHKLSSTVSNNYYNPTRQHIKKAMEVTVKGGKDKVKSLADEVSNLTEDERIRLVALLAK